MRALRLRRGPIRCTVALTVGVLLTGCGSTASMGSRASDPTSGGLGAPGAPAGATPAAVAVDAAGAATGAATGAARDAGQAQTSRSEAVPPGSTPAHASERTLRVGTYYFDTD